MMTARSRRPTKPPPHFSREGVFAGPFGESLETIREPADHTLKPTWTSTCNSKPTPGCFRPRPANCRPACVSTPWFEIRRPSFSPSKPDAPRTMCRGSRHWPAPSGPPSKPARSTTTPPGNVPGVTTRNLAALGAPSLKVQSRDTGRHGQGSSGCFYPVEANRG
jgi:hypothetical protein